MKQQWKRFLTGILAAGMLLGCVPNAIASDADGYKVRQMGQVTVYASALVRGSDGFNMFLALNGYIPKTISMTMTGNFTPQQQLDVLGDNLNDNYSRLPFFSLTVHATAPADTEEESMYYVLNHGQFYSNNKYASSITPSQAVYNILPPGNQPMEGLSFHGDCMSFWVSGEDTWRTTTRCIYLDEQPVVQWTTEDGRIVSYQFFDTSFQAVQEDTSAIAVTPTTSKMYVDGKEVSLGAYLIDDTNYIRLRDIASLLDGSPAQFDVAWHQEGGQIELLPRQSYTPTGVELGQLSPATALRSRSILTRMYEPLFSNGPYTTAEFLPMAYNIGGNNFYKLRDIAHIADFTVLWDDETKSVHIISEKNDYFRLVY